MYASPTKCMHTMIKTIPNILSICIAIMYSVYQHMSSFSFHGWRQGSSCGLHHLWHCPNFSATTWLRRIETLSRTPQNTNHVHFSKPEVPEESLQFTSQGSLTGISRIQTVKNTYLFYLTRNNCPKIWRIFRMDLPRTLFLFGSADHKLASGHFGHTCLCSGML